MSALAEKTILITGASQGIGRFLSIYFATRTSNVFGLARSAKGLTDTASEALSVGGRFMPLHGDLRDPGLPERAAMEISERTKSLDIIIHNAADVTSKPFAHTEGDEIASLMETNVTGPLRLTRALLPLLEAGRSPSIVFISSLAGYKANPAQTAYSISKGAVNAAADALRTELGPAGFHVMCVALPSVGTMDRHEAGQVPVAVFAQRLEEAIEARRDELWMSTASKWLMRAYSAWPALAKISKGNA